MDRLWSPWRAKYIAAGVDLGASSCVFCKIAEDSQRDEQNFVLYRGAHNFVTLNLYPYITGHLLVIPYEHLDDLVNANKATTDELMDLTKRSEAAIRTVYSPPGLNLGMNLGAAAGAGIADHIHLHVLPRWSGDTNFMTSVAETRVLPEDLETTYSRLRGKF